jgi:Periplasmic binding protein-like domain/Transmembrane secretion effector
LTTWPASATAASCTLTAATSPALPTAIFAANDRCARGLLDTLIRARVDVPGDISVAGYDDSEVARLSFINLTTVRQDAALVGRELLVSAVSLFEVVLNASRILGPAAGGVILTTAGPAPCFAVNALSFLAPIIVLLCYRPAQKTTPDRTRTRPRGAVREGLRYVRSVPEIRALLAARSKGHPSGRVVLLLAAATTCSMAVTAFAPDLAVGFVGLFLSGFASIWYIATANTLVQLRAGAQLRGRIMGVWVMALPGTTPLTSLLAAGLASAAGIRFAYFTAGLVILAAALAGGRALWPASGRAAVEG